MRIGIVCGSSPPIKCGVGDFGARLARELAAQGHEVVVVTDRGAAAIEGERLIVRPAVSSWGLQGLPSVLRALARERVSLVNIQYPTQQYGRVSLIDLLPLAIRTRLHLPVVTTIHEYTTYRRLGRMRIANLVSTSNASIMTEAANLRAVAKSVPRLGRKLHAVGIGPNIEPQLPSGFDRDAWRLSHDVRPGNLALAFFGFISPTKGLDTLLDAMERLPADRFHLWLLADRLPDAPAHVAYHLHIAERISSSSLAPRVTWTGYLEPTQLSAYLAAADLGVMPFSDGASLRRGSMLAALVHGLPVLSTGERSPIEGVDVVPIGDANGLERAIVRLSEDGERLAALAEGARRTGARMSWPTIAAQTASVFEKFDRN